MAVKDHTGCNDQQKTPFGNDGRAWWGQKLFSLQIVRRKHRREPSKTSRKTQETKFYRRLEVLLFDEHQEMCCYINKRIHSYLFWNDFSIVYISLCLNYWATDFFLWITTQRVIFSSVWALSLNTMRDGWRSPIKHYIKRRYIVIIVITSRGSNWYMMMNLSLLSSPWKKSLWIKSERAVYQPSSVILCVCVCVSTL